MTYTIDYSDLNRYHLMHCSLVDYPSQLSQRFDVLSQRCDNWDGYQSKKPSHEVLAYAKNLLYTFLNDIVSANHLWVEPFISSDEDGYITAEWYNNEKELHLLIKNNKAEYIQVWGTNIDTEMHMDSLTNANYIALWEWLLF